MVTISKILRASAEAVAENRPSLVACKTLIGKELQISKERVQPTVRR